MAGKSAGRTSRTFRKLAANLKAQRRPCCHCGQAIDYSIEDHNSPDAFTVEHLKPWSTHPHLAEDPSNLDASHRRCNASRGTGEMAPTLGETSRDW
jgi:5-methylcytosine-specific restriction endonuclease McrA